MSIRVGSVPYVNAAPLVWAFESAGPVSPVEVVYEVPSRLPALLDSGDCAAVMVSSVDGLRVPGRRMAAGVGIVSHGAVQSVRMFSKVPPEKIRRLALDAASMTSNRLALLLLRQLYGVHEPETAVRTPDLPTMLEDADAAVLIGDPGMEASGDGLYVVDLGEAWTRLTGLPFLWAAWFGGDGLTSEVAGYLNAAFLAGWQPSREPAPAWLPRFANPVAEVVRFASARSGWPEDRVERYLRESIAFEIDERVLTGYREFGRRLREVGFADATEFPQLVVPSRTPAGV